VDSPVLLPDKRAEMRGTHAGAIIFAGIGAANIGNYLFHLLSARALGPGPYGDLATLTAVTALIALPLSGVQVFVARFAAGCAARGEQDRLVAFARQSLRIAAICAVSLTVLLLLAAPITRSALSIGSLTAVILTALITIPSVLTPVLLGLAQGLQRFPLVSVGISIGPVVRIALVVGLLVTGFSVAGAMGATLVTSVLAVAVPAAVLWPLLTAHTSGEEQTATRRDARELVPVVAGLLAITALSTSDLVVAKSVFDDELAGAYGAASLIGRAILYLPAAIVTVLLPKVAARSAEEKGTHHILSGSLLVAGVFCGAAALVYALVPGLVVDIAFGSEYEDAAPLLPLFGLAMSAYALLSVMLTYHLGKGDWRMSWLLVGGAVVEAIGFALFHDSPRQLLGVSAVIALTLLLIHEVAFDASITRALRFAVAMAGRNRKR
jgi:O-antigen/teichoic acid export membrane protein